MARSSEEKPELIELPKVADPRGCLTSLQGGIELPFEIKRAYYIYDVPSGSTRGGHAHKYGHDIVVALAGSVDISLSNRDFNTTYTLNDPSKGLLRPPGYWITLCNFAPGSVLLVLSDSLYDEDAYVRDFDDFSSL